MLKKSTLTRVIAITSAVALTVGLSATFSTSSQAAGTGEVKSISALVPASVKSAGVLTSVGAAYPPAFIHNADNTLTGWDVETIREVGKILGLKVTVQDIAFANVIPSLQAGKYATAMGEIYITAERLKYVDFVTTHKSGDVIMMPVASPIVAPKVATDLCGYSLAATTGSAEEKSILDIVAACKAAGEEGTQLRSFATAPQMLLALNQGRVQAIVNSASQAAYEVKQTFKKGKAIYKVANLPFVTSYDVGIAVARNADSAQLDKAIQAAVNYMIKNGTLKKINDKFNEGQGMISSSQIMTGATN